ncbi:hypothetical protein GSI_04305 [Ganoderma sinense ZZ0214-1]|uniref:Uncharacterized protein n=1 Tax=Ganoderma sinense ZZ0214-1 TaxID=1077348 RepID=A0A2G8SIU3_9APHY|nr:hypothetical protein GSI_04305 [Ganoderma sinense ZZ0214-1]
MPYFFHSPDFSNGPSGVRTSESDATTMSPAPLPPARRFEVSRKAPSSPITIFPLQRRFAVVQVDPVAMVMMAGLGRDVEALAAAKALVTKKYLVYLESGIDLPMPQSQWCRYRVNPVATTLREECPEWGASPDMVLPIPPNTAHLRVPSPFVDVKDPGYVFKFPFKNCFFWVDSDTELRIRVRGGDAGYDDRKAVALAFRPHLRLRGSFGPDLARMSDFLSQPRDKPATHPPTAASDGTPTMPPNPHYDAMVGRLPRLLDGLEGSDNRPANDAHHDEASSTSDSQPSSMPPPVEELLSLDLFGWLPDPATKYIPLVNCWLELEEHLSESTIPSPVGLWTEQQRIGAIINAAIERRNAALAATQPPPVPVSPGETLPQATSEPPGKMSGP